MFRAINEYLSKVNIINSDDITNRINSFLDNEEEVSRHVVSLSFNRYIVDITLKEFGIDEATRIFNLFNYNVSYPYSSMHVRFNEGKCVRYRYITCKEDKDGFYCDIIIH